MGDEKKTLPPGVQPYDKLNGVRVGALAGGVVGILPAVLLWPAFGWVIGGAAVGGVVGYFWQRREEQQRTND